MKRFSLLLVVISLLMFAGIAEAGVMSNVKDWVTGNFLALAASAVLAIGVVAALVGIISTVARELGEALINFSDMVADGKVSKEEIDSFKKEVKDVVNAISLFKKVK